MKSNAFLTLGLLLSSGIVYAINRPMNNGGDLEAPPLTTLSTPTSSIPALPGAKPVSLGIISKPVPQDLVAYLELSGFPGILVSKVIPDSPAAQAGLKENDVIVKLGDTPLSGPESVPLALEGKMPGETVTAVFYRKGNQESAEIKLDTRNMSAEEILAAQETSPSFNQRGQQMSRHSSRVSPDPVGQIQSLFSASPGLPHHSSGAAEAIDQMTQLMNALMSGQLPNDAKALEAILGQMNISPRAMQMLQGLQAMGVGNVAMPPVGCVSSSSSSYGSSTVQMSDNQGTIIISQSSDRGTYVKVTDPAGTVLYSGPYNTKEEKEAVPPEVRERLSNIESNVCF